EARVVGWRRARRDARRPPRVPAGPGDPRRRTGRPPRRRAQVGRGRAEPRSLRLSKGTGRTALSLREPQGANTPTPPGGSRQARPEGSARPDEGGSAPSPEGQARAPHQTPRGARGRQRVRLGLPKSPARTLRAEPRSLRLSKGT